MELPLILYCDNNGAIAHAKEPKSLNKSKHIERQYHNIQEIIISGDEAMQKIASTDNLADPLTKPLSQVVLDRQLE